MTDNNVSNQTKLLEDTELKRGAKIFLSTEDAIDALRANGRLVGALTYGWTSPGLCDAGGHYFAAVRRFLRSKDGAHVVGVFWECAATPLRLSRCAAAAASPALCDSEIACLTLRCVLVCFRVTQLRQPAAEAADFRGRRLV